MIITTIKLDWWITVVNFDPNYLLTSAQILISGMNIDRILPRICMKKISFKIVLRKFPVT